VTSDEAQKIRKMRLEINIIWERSNLIEQLEELEIENENFGDLKTVKASIEQLELERKALIKQLEELRIENNKNLSDINNIKLDIYLLSKEIGKASELVLSNNFAKRRHEITQLTKDIKQRIEILDSTPNPKSYSQVEFINDPFLQPYINTGQDPEICKKSPEGSLINDVREGKWTWYDLYNRIIKQGNYVNGKKEGQWTEWLGTGYAYDTIEMNYKNDELDGKWVHWYSSEHPYTSHQRNEREMNTRYEIYRLKADLKSKEVEIAYEEIIAQRELREKDTEKLEDEYKKLEIHIKNKEKLLFNLELLGEFPRILAEGNYINGKKEGVWTIFNRDFVRINKEEIYEDGVLIEK
jgi:antitoxin component YwqK of YwqJK toxin-antitoxin module